MLWGIQITGNLNSLESGKRYSCVPEGEHEKLQERVNELEDYLVEFGDHKHGCLAIATNNKEHCTCGFEQAKKG